MPHAPRILALDTASPVVSIALADPESVLASRALEQVQSSKRLLPLLAEILAEAGVELDAIDGLVALRGPGSFTGLRVGLATALGLHQALDLPATAVPTFEALAAASGLEGGGLGPDDGRDAVVAVDVLRGEWVVQRFTSAALPQPLDEPRRLPASELATLAPCRLIGFGADSLGEIPGVELLVPPPLAPALALDAARRPPPVERRASDRAPLLPTAGGERTEAQARSAAPVNRPGEIVLRPAHVGDLEPVVELEARTFEEPWGRLSVAAELAQKHALVLLAERAGAGSAGRVVGYAAFRLLPPEAELLRLATLPAQRRRGIALRLVEAGLDELASRGMRRCLLEVRRTNRPARALYERAGFRPVGARRGYYQDGTDAVLYERRIDPA